MKNRSETLKKTIQNRVKIIKGIPNNGISPYAKETLIRNLNYFRSKLKEPS